MSYCRWSSDDFSCDLYCYANASTGGWTTLVANSRIGDRPREAGVAPRMTPIGLAFDGQTFQDPTLSEFRARIVGLREAGYRFPDCVLKRIDAEILERESGNSV